MFNRLVSSGGSRERASHACGRKGGTPRAQVRKSCVFNLYLVYLTLRPLHHSKLLVASCSSFTFSLSLTFSFHWRVCLISLTLSCFQLPSPMANCLPPAHHEGYFSVTELFIILHITCFSFSFLFDILPSLPLLLVSDGAQCSYSH